jgi:hypothetical protein
VIIRSGDSGHPFDGRRPEHARRARLGQRRRAVLHPRRGRALVPGLKLEGEIHDSNDQRADAVRLPRRRVRVLTTADDKLYGWGMVGSGSLGDGTTMSSLKPIFLMH